MNELGQETFFKSKHSILLLVIVIKTQLNCNRYLFLLWVLFSGFVKIRS